MPVVLHQDDYVRWLSNIEPDPRAVPGRVHDHVADLDLRELAGQ
jgi:hypothetical protein